MARAFLVNSRMGTANLLFCINTKQKQRDKRFLRGNPFSIKTRSYCLIKEVMKM
jgi:hypothetical protein